MTLALVLLTLTSPDRQVALKLETKPAPHLSVTLSGRPVLLPSPVVFTLDGADVSAGAKPGRIHRGRSGPCATAQIPFKNKITYFLELYACNDGIAFRHLVSQSGPPIPGEATEFKLPAGSTVWSHDLEGHYEALHVKRKIEEFPAGQWAGPPATYELPGGAGFASITEAALYRYPGMALQADGQGALVTRLGHEHPPSYPFRLRYKDDIERLKEPAVIAGPILTPWRTILIGKDLNALVNSNMIRTLAPPPVPHLFPHGPATSWVKPGRAVWKYLDGGQNDAATVREFSRLAAQLGFEYQVVEGFWQKWPIDELKAVIAESRAQGVGLILWKHSNQLRTPEARKQFFELISSAGAAGAKIDFFDHEAKEVVDLYEILLLDAAHLKLVLNFHGANKPSGETYTWPNELTREAVRGMESRKSERARHDATIPFTRLLAGPADYTPVHFGERRNDTTWAHQLATAVAFTSGLLTYAAHPKALLENPAVELIKTIPATWDETRVLPGSAIGEVAVLARRKGSTWFLSVINGAEPRKLSVDLTFLPAGSYRALAAAEKPGNPAAVEMQPAEWTRATKVTLDLPAGGGFLARLTK